MIDRIQVPSDVIKRRREALGLDYDAAAAATGMTNYYDTETYGDDMWVCTSIIEVLRLCKAFRLTPDEVFGGSASTSGIAPGHGKHPVGGLSSLRGLIADELARTGESVGQFEDRVGWELQGFLAGTASGLHWNMDGLADVCDGCGADWLAVLRSEFNASNWEREGLRG
jgi:hypothetical protein